MYKLAVDAMGGDFDPVVTNTVFKVNETEQIPLFLKFRSNPLGLAPCLCYGLASEGKRDLW